MEDLETKEEDNSTLVVGFGRLKRGDEEDEEDGEAYLIEAAAVAAAEMDAIYRAKKIGFGEEDG